MGAAGKKSAGEKIWEQTPHLSAVASRNPMAVGAGGDGGEAGVFTTLLGQDPECARAP